MMGYQNCIDWCHDHPALLTLLLILSILFPVFLYVTTRSSTASLANDSRRVNSLPDLEKGQPTLEFHTPPDHRSAWKRLLMMLRPSCYNLDDHDISDHDEYIEPQEKTPLIGSMPGDQAWRIGGQLPNNWHGTNQLNTSWSYMA